MSYITVDDVLTSMPEAELIQCTDDEKAGEVNLDRVEAKIADAEAEIDSYAGVVYDLPLQTSNRVKQLAIAIAIYRLEERRRRIREDTRKAYEDAIRFLERLAAGKATLDQPTGETAQTPAQEVKATEADDVFSDDNLDAF